MGLPNTSALTDWTEWAGTAIVRPITRSMAGIAGEVQNAIFGPFRKHLGNFGFVQAAALINNPRVHLRNQIQSRLPADRLRVSRIARTIRSSGEPALVALLNDYLDRLTAVEQAVESLIGRRMPIVDGLFYDLKTLLGPPDPTRVFPSSVLAMLEEVGDAFADVLGELQIISGGAPKPPGPSGLAPGHFYDWVCCRTTFDDEHFATDPKRKEQQRLRHTMLKVLLSYVDDVDLSPSGFSAGAKPEALTTSFGGFPLTSAGTRSVARDTGGVLRAWSGLLAAAFEHVFVSARPLDAVESGAPSDRYHDLPLTLKLQRPELSAPAFSRPGYSMFPELELRSEFLAMKTAMTSAGVTSTAVRTAINSIGNGIWEISPNNPPLVDTVASLVAASVYELEKAFLYDLLRRFRVYVTDGADQTSGELVIARASVNVPDFSPGGSTEKTLTAVVGLACEDTALLEAVRNVFGALPVSLDGPAGTGAKGELAGLLRGLMKDSLAVGCVVYG